MLKTFLGRLRGNPEKRMAVYVAAAQKLFFELSTRTTTEEDQYLNKLANMIETYRIAWQYQATGADRDREECETRIRAFETWAEGLLRTSTDPRDRREQVKRHLELRLLAIFQDPTNFEGIYEWKSRRAEAYLIHARAEGLHEKLQEIAARHCIEVTLPRLKY